MIGLVGGTICPPKVDVIPAEDSVIPTETLLFIAAVI
jgi:hypothetical protein